MIALLGTFLFLVLVFGVLFGAGYALLHDYPIWQIAGAVLAVVVIFAIVGFSLSRG